MQGTWLRALARKGSVAEAFFALRSRGTPRFSSSSSSSSSSADSLDLDRQYDHVCGTQAKLYVPKSHGGGGGVARIQLDRMQARNALGREMVADLEACVAKATELSLAHKVRCLVLHSVSESVFCAGADLKERRAMSEDEVVAFVMRLRKSTMALERVPVPTVAALGGVALGGGLELALACDLRCGSDTCVVGLPETRLAIIPGAGGTQRLSRLIGISKAKDLIFTGRTLKAYEAYELGLLDRYAPVQTTAMEEAMKVAMVIAEGGPVALQQAKKAVQEGLECGGNIEEAMLVEERCYAKVVPTADRLEALEAFAEKRKPAFTGN